MDQEKTQNQGKESMRKFIEWFGIATAISTLIALVIFDRNLSRYMEMGVRFLSCIGLVYLGVLIRIKYLKQENKDLQETIFTHEAVIRELERKAGGYEGEEP